MSIFDPRDRKACLTSKFISTLNDELGIGQSKDIKVLINHLMEDDNSKQLDIPKLTRILEEQEHS